MYCNVIILQASVETTLLWGGQKVQVVHERGWGEGGQIVDWLGFVAGVPHVKPGVHRALDVTKRRSGEQADTSGN